MVHQNDVQSNGMRYTLCLYYKYQSLYNTPRNALNGQKVECLRVKLSVVHIITTVTYRVDSYQGLFICKINICTTIIHNNIVLCFLLHVSAELRHLQAVYTPIFKAH
jgi:hypothetical protein